VCGRYTLTSPNPAEVRARFNIAESVEVRQRYNVAPGDDVLAVTTDKAGAPRGELLRSMYSSDAIALFAAVKHAFDPANLLNPGVIVDPVPIDADHISIVKPLDRNSLLYMRVRQFIELIPAVAERSGDIEVLALPIIRSDQPINIVPKLIRIAALCLVVLIAFKGVQALIAPPVDIGKIQGPLVEQLAEKDRQIAKLLAVLDGKRTTPAPPGADQELKKAVIAIDEGAKVDSRYAQALDLLKAGRPSEAEPLLKAVAEDKVRIADKESKDAAAAYRNLASIASVSSPGRARDYYARAAQLDPDNIEGLYWNGSYQLQAGKLDAAQAALAPAGPTLGGQRAGDVEHGVAVENQHAKTARTAHELANDSAKHGIGRRHLEAREDKRQGAW